LGRSRQIAERLNSTENIVRTLEMNGNDISVQEIKNPSFWCESSKGGRAASCLGVVLTC
jgi:hypothetical protein